MTNPFDLRCLDTVQLVPPTPFTPDGKQVVASALSQLVRNLAAAGIRVFLPAAGTGEFHSLSVDEVIQCVRATREAVADDVTVIAPIGFSVEHAVAIGRRAEDAGADALLLMPSIHPYLCDAGFRDYFCAIKQQVSLPLLTYKRGPVPSDKLLLELGRERMLAGVKYAVNDMDAFARFAGASGETLGLYCGTAERWAPYFMLAGATGYTSGAGSVAPKLTLALYRALRSGARDEATRLLSELRPLEEYRARDADSYNIAAIKVAVSCLGTDFGPCRPPQRKLSPEEQTEIRQIVAALQEVESRVEVLADGR
jgi:4-hydroxy-tetrahydrodipicolinate synthase